MSPKQSPVPKGFRAFAFLQHKSMGKLTELKPKISTISGKLMLHSFTDTERIRGTTLQNIRKAHFEKHPLCVMCQAIGITRIATELDHVRSLQLGGKESRDPFENRQGLCREHHEQKSQEELGRTYTPK